MAVWTFRSGVCVLAAAGVAGLIGAGAREGPPNAYRVHSLTSDVPGAAAHLDPHLVNGWGIAAGPTSPWWVSAADGGVSTLYNQDGVPQQLVVAIPGPTGSPDPGHPTGVVFIPSNDFTVNNGTTSGPAKFVFATEDGILIGWSPVVPPITQGVLAADRTNVGANFKGVTLAHSATRGDLLYAADFHNARVDVFNTQFGLVKDLGAGAFKDPATPRGYAPFGIQAIENRVFVSYAVQDEDAEDEVAGQGRGRVSVYDADGVLLQHFDAHGQMNAPWGMARAPDGFGVFSGAVLVGNFGDGRINAFDFATGAYLGRLQLESGRALAIDGLWGIGFGNDSMAGSKHVLYFAAGPDDEAHGLFGSVEFVGR